MSWQNILEQSLLTTLAPFSGQKKHMTYLKITNLLDHPSVIIVNCKH